MKTQVEIRNALSAAGIKISDSRYIRAEQVGHIIFAAWSDWAAYDKDLFYNRTVILHADSLIVYNDSLFYADGYDAETARANEEAQEQSLMTTLLCAYRLAFNPDYSADTNEGSALLDWADVHLGEAVVDLLI